MKRHEYLVWLKNDVRLSQSCYEVRRALVDSFTDSSRHKPEFVKYFQIPPQLPFVIQDHTPEKIVILQKIINALFAAEQALAKLFHEDEINLKTRNMNAGSLAEPMQEAIMHFQEVFALYDAMPEISSLIGSNLDSLAPKVNIVTEAQMLLRAEPNEALSLAMLSKVPELSKDQVKPELEHVTPATLYQEIVRFKTADNLHDFFHNTFHSFLFKNLDEDVLERLSIGPRGFSPKKQSEKESSQMGWLEWVSEAVQGITPDKTFPIQINRCDAKSIILYQEVLNAWFSIEQTLHALENLTGEASPKDYAPLLANLNRDMRTLHEASKEPVLKEIIEQGLRLLDPLMKMPYLHLYLQKSEVVPEKPVLDIVKAWKSAEFIKPLVTEPLVVEEDPIQEIEDWLTDKFPGISDPIKQFLKEVRQSTHDRERLKEISSALSKDGNEVDKLKQLGFDLVLAADDTEFKMRFKFGHLSNQIQAGFAELFSQMLQELSLENNQVRLRAEIEWRIAVIDARTVAEEQRMQAIHDDKRYEQLFAMKHPEIDKLEAIYGALEDLKSDLDKPTMETLYRQLQPFINEYPELVEEFTEDYVTRTSEANLKDVLEELMEICSHISEPLSHYEMLCDLYLGKDISFKHMDMKEQFLTHYQAVQPFLQQIDPRYDLKFFLLELQTPEDFARELEKIYHLRPALLDLVKAHEAVKEARIAMCEKRQDGIGELILFEQDGILHLVAALKAKIFDKYFDEARERLSAEFGPDYIASFMKPEIRDEFLKKFAPVGEVWDRDKFLKDNVHEGSIETAIVDELNHIIAIDRKVKKIKNDISEVLMDVKAMIASEESHIDQANLSQLQKIEALRKLEDTLSQRIVTKYADFKEVEAWISERIREKDAIHMNYDKMKKVFGVLNEMENYLKTNYTDEITTKPHVVAKMGEIQLLKNLLTEPSCQPLARLQKVSQRLATKVSHEILYKNADPWWLKLLQKLVACCFTPREKQTVSFFRHKVDSLSGDIPAPKGSDLEDNEHFKPPVDH